MSSYHYVVFPRGKQPTADEVREFQKFAGALANQFAWGTCRDDGRLALAVDRQSCDHVQQIEAPEQGLAAARRFGRRFVVPRHRLRSP